MNWNNVIYVHLGLSGREISVTLRTEGKHNPVTREVLCERRAGIVIISCTVCSHKTKITPCGKCTLFQVGKGVTQEGI